MFIAKRAFPLTFYYLVSINRIHLCVLFLNFYVHRPIFVAPDPLINVPDVSVVVQRLQSIIYINNAVQTTFSKHAEIYTM